MKVNRITLCAMILAIIIILGLFPGIPIAFIPVPIVLQNFGILLAGLLLRKSEAFTVVTIFLLMAAAGIPVLSGGRGGLGLFFGPTGGYLIAYPICAFMIAWAMEKVKKPASFFKVFIPVFLFGVILLDVIGTFGMTLTLGMPITKALYAQIAFIPGDAIKAVIASLIYVLLPVKISNNA